MPISSFTIIWEKIEMYRKKEFRKKLFFLERVMGIEPTYLAWKASVLPLNYTRIYWVT